MFKANPQTYKLRKDLLGISEDLKEKIQYMEDLFQQIEEKNQSAADNQERVEAANTKIKELEKEYAEKRRAFQVQFKLDVKEDKKNTMNQIAEELGYLVVTLADHNDLNDKVFNAEKSIEEAVKKANTSAANKYNAEKRNLEADHKVAVAETNARNIALSDSVTRLKEEVERLNKALQEAQITAREVGKSSAVSQQFGKQ